MDEYKTTKNMHHLEREEKKKLIAQHRRPMTVDINPISIHR